ncbi:MAG: hypothetical protein EVA77_07025 [Phycisphaeraceae bacterium]|nr:MAG: hypothetical protein EVA77_07025 [Phycisphaeraceae bacterium]
MHHRQLVRELASLECSPIVVGSHPRSGTHLTIDLIRNHIRGARGWKFPGEPLDALFVDLDWLGSPLHKGFETRAIRTFRRIPHCLIKTHTPFGWKSWLDRARSNPELSPWADWLRDRCSVVYVHRDGRSALCSWHLMSKYRNEEARQPLSDWLRQSEIQTGLSRPAAWAKHLESWSSEGVYTIDSKSVQSSPEGFLNSLCNQFGCELLDKPVALPVQWSSLFRRRLARAFCTHVESTSQMGRYLGKQPQKWQAAFSPEDRAFFHKEAGATLQKFGYVQDSSWVKGGELD